jgi:hypothetical protein
MAEDNTPTNVVDVGNVHDNPNYKVTLNVDNNGNVIIYRSTNTPDRFSDTDFSKFEINKTIGEQTYFASNPEFAQSFSQSGKRNIYSFSTNIKPEEILHLQSNIYKNKELLNKLGGQEYINNIINERGINNYRFDSLDNIPKNLTWAELYYSTNKGRTNGSKEILQREIVKLQNSGVKAIGVSPVSGAKNEYNILPIVNEQSQLDIVAKGLIDKNLKETPIDTPGGSLGAAKLNDPLVFDSWVDNYAKTTTSFIDNLPLSTTVKNQFNNLVKGRARNLATPGGVADAVDVWELGVLGLMIAAVAYKEYDEIPTILTNKAIDMFNNMTSFYNIPPVPKEEYNLDYEFINKVVETGEKFMPTDIIINKVVEESKKTYIPYGDFETKKENVDPQETARILKDIATSPASYYRPTSNREAIESMNNQQTTDTMETTQKIQLGVQEEKMFEQARPKKNRSGGSGGGSGARIE